FVTRTIRLDKWLAEMGKGSRKQLRSLIREGQVLVNEEIIKDAGYHVAPGRDTVSLAGEEIKYQPYVYYMLNKPEGVLSATEDKTQPTVIDLLTQEERHFAPFPVGRLDKDTTGLLLLTNDGQLARELLSPKKHVPKTYQVTLDQPLDEYACKLLQNGVKLKDDYMTKPAVVELTEEDLVVYLTIHEGKYHQVKRMMA